MDNNIYWACHIYEHTMGLYNTKEEAIADAWQQSEENVFPVIRLTPEQLEKLLGKDIEG